MCVCGLFGNILQEPKLWAFTRTEPEGASGRLKQLGGLVWKICKEMCKPCKNSTENLPRHKDTKMSCLVLEYKTSICCKNPSCGHTPTLQAIFHGRSTIRKLQLRRCKHIWLSHCSICQPIVCLRLSESMCVSMSNKPKSPDETQKSFILKSESKRGLSSAPCIPADVLSQPLCTLLFSPASRKLSAVHSQY